MAANNRNKLDEYHLKILRELLTYPANKYCFDCHQRGPTYVNITIGSFVCTRCSGMLRGLTPPHRVKSITMATFTPEEIDIMKSRGNEYCKNLWLGLYDAEIPIKDEQQIKDFMIAKYEKKRYYADPVISNTHCVLNFANGSRTPSSISSTSSSSHNSPSSQNLSDSSTKAQPAVRSQFSSKANSVTSSTNSSQLFPTNFESPMSSSASSVDPFGSSGLDSSSCSESSFANFDNNPAFGSNRSVPATRNTIGNGGVFTNYNNNFAGLGLSWALPNNTLYRPSYKGLPLNFGRWSIATDNNVSFGKTNTESNVPAEDKYAALKDLDFQRKNQMLEKQQQEMQQKMNSSAEWGSGTNGINWQTVFSNHPGVNSEPSTPFNPFAAGDINAWNPSTNGTVNPFGSNIKDVWNGNMSWQHSKNQIQSAVTSPNGWNKDVANPFKFQMGIWTQANGQHQSSNPFL
ncbi:arf-GAP domain and FG repeat-containing protein 1 isoform X1 [Planococcus citri]|uniref:arf-GAP domain and FG repeat-containing protein 1 isoform X1 n=1 Tax=Planococcus citri TaxID=170843 RepID=UPI0031F88A98